MKRAMDTKVLHMCTWIANDDWHDYPWVIAQITMHNVIYLICWDQGMLIERSAGSTYDG
jgi:hypothetical protein